MMRLSGTFSFFCCGFHVIGYPDVVDLWVIKIKKAHESLRMYSSTSRSSDQSMQITQREHVRGLHIL